MGKLFRSRSAVSSAVALLIAILIVGTFVSALLYISNLQIQNIGEGLKPVEQLGEAEREKIDAELIDSDGATVRVKIKNTRLIMLTITNALFTQSDGSLKVVDVPDR
ncbi:MAG: hypothetical protein RMJ15_08970 [Nitrososphaerota archaeon]|nr:hypothetical protein [Nitrososphaerota archaeon]